MTTTPLQLLGKELSQQIKTDLAQKVKTTFTTQQKFVAILYFGEEYSSATYVKHKQKYGEDI